MVLDRALAYGKEKKKSITDYAKKLSGMVRYLKPSNTGVVLVDGVNTEIIPGETLIDLLKTESPDVKRFDLKAIQDPQALYHAMKQKRRWKG